MAETVALRYQHRNTVFEKSPRYIALRARAGMESAMQADLAAIAAKRVKKRSADGRFQIVDARASETSLEQNLDWLRARPAVAAASHVFRIKGRKGLVIPSGHIHLVFDETVPGHIHEAIFTRYRLQAVEQRGNNDYLVRITTGSKNPITTAAHLQSERSVTFAEPELVEVA